MPDVMHPVSFEAAPEKEFAALTTVVSPEAFPAGLNPSR
jgi:hypothetical protein